MIFLGVLVIVFGAMAYVRLAPISVSKWHVPIEATADKDFAGGLIRVVQVEADALTQIDEVARALPQTYVLAGMVAERRITYVTRSKWIGFPDFTTIEQSGDTLKIYARLRFGRSDLGVNRKRVRQLLAALQ